MEEIQKVLVSANEEKTPDPKMTEVISELGLVMEFHEAMDSMEQSLVMKIKNKRLSKEEEEDKLLFVGMRYDCRGRNTSHDELREVKG